MGELAIMDKEKGDTKVIWDAENEDEVEAARSQFNTLVGKGFLAYQVTGAGRKGAQVRDFDPSIEKIILTPQMRGG